MSEGLEDTDVAVEMHSLLLSLAGFVDDELLGWCRELVAVGESDYAMELVVATVQADRVRLPGPLHDELHDSAVRRRALSRAEALPPPDHAPRMRHRFIADPAEHGFPEREEEQSPEYALQSVPHRLLRDCQLWLTWRITPAGGASGPVPHPVVLIEVLDNAGADVLAYQVAEVLSRVGVFASVEVFTAGADLNEYHRCALADAQLIVSQEGHDEHPFGEPSGPGGSGPGGAPNNGRNGTPPGRPANAPLPTTESGSRSHPRPNPSAVSSTSETGGPPVSPSAQDGPRRTPLHPVDRVITARGSAPRRPRLDNAERQPGSLDDVVAGLSFERGRDCAAPEDPFLTAETETSNGETPVESPPVEPPAERRAPSRDALWGPSRDGESQPPAEEQQERPRPRPRGFPTVVRGNQTSSGLPKRTPPGEDPAETAESGLSDVEQRLLRQLHEELAAREDDDEPTENESPPPRMFRGNGTNGGRKRRPS